MRQNFGSLELKRLEDEGQEGLRKLVTYGSVVTSTCKRHLLNNQVGRRGKEGQVEIRVRERFEDATLMALEMEEGSMSQGKQALSRCWKTQ